MVVTSRTGLRIGALIAACGTLAFAAAAQADGCAGSAGCPYSSMSITGARGEGLLRFPQTVALGPDNLIYVGDQFSHLIEVFTPQGKFVREFGGAGTKPGQLGAVGGLAVADDGTVYVAGSGNRVDRFGPDGGFLGSFGQTGTAAGEFNFGSGSGNDSGAGGGIATAGGQVFVADTRNDRIQRFSADGSDPAVIVPNSGTLLRPQGLTIHGTRMIVADDDHHRLLAFDLGGRQLKSIGAGLGNGPGQLQNPYDVALDAAGHVFVADNSNHRVLRFDTLPNYAYEARWGSYGAGLGQLQYPRGIAANAQGENYVANTGANRIEVFDPNGKALRSFGSSARVAGQFIAPLGVAADASGTVAVADSVDGRIELFGADGKPLAVWGSPRPGPTVLPLPVAMVFDAAGTGYVLDQQRARILVFDRAGNVQRTIGSQGTGPGQLEAPSALAIDSAAHLYVADTGNGRIATFAADGSYLGSLGDFGSIRGIAVAPDGSTIYASDAATNRIYVLGADGSEQAVIGGTGNKAGKLNTPAQLALAADNTLWVADRGNSRIQEFGPDHKVITTFGGRGFGAGQFIHPTGLAIDCRGVLTVSDTDNNRIEQFTLATPPAGVTCASLPPVSGPLVAELPLLPPPVAPDVQVQVLRVSKLFSQRTIPVSVRCDMRCTATLTAKLRPRVTPKKKKGHKRPKPTIVSLGRNRKLLPAGQKVTLRATLSHADIRRLRKALKGRKGMYVDLQITASGSNTAPTVVTKHLAASG